MDMKYDVLEDETPDVDICTSETMFFSTQI